MKKEPERESGYNEGPFGVVFEPEDGREVYYEINSERQRLSPGSRRLMLAILEDAVAVRQKHFDARDPKGRELFLAAKNWIEADDLQWPFSFSNICDVLKLDPDYIRQGFHAMEERRVVAESTDRRPRRKAVIYSL